MIGERIRELRLSLGMSQTELAEAAHLDKSALSLIENGKRYPGSRTIPRLAAALGASEAELTLTTTASKLIDVAGDLVRIGRMTD
jgi:transcriptional regulator with XRE-family HTH domain